MKYCPECDELIPLDAVYCQYCGINTQDPSDITNRSGSESGSGEGTQEPPQLPDPHSIPFSQVLVSLLLLLVSFWGLSTSLTILPVFLDPQNTDYLLTVGIIVQVLLRIFIAFLAIDGRYASGHGTLEGKIATAVLAFIPLGALYSFLYAARSLSRRRYLPTLTSSAIGASAVAAILIFSTYSPLTRVAAQVNPSSIPDLESPPTESPTQVAPTATISPTIEKATVVVSNPQVDNPITNCLSPSEITLDYEGDEVEICGQVSNYGTLDCEWCPKGEVSYILLNKTFRIISYDWEFTFAWLGDCLKVSDSIEEFGGKPVLVFSRGEGFAGSQCSSNAQGELICEDGGYFQTWDGCD